MDASTIGFLISLVVFLGAFFIYHKTKKKRPNPNYGKNGFCEKCGLPFFPQESSTGFQSNSCQCGGVL